MPFTLAVVLAVLGQAAPLFRPQPARLELVVRTDVPAAVPGRPFTVIVDASPAPGIHVYAPGNPGYRPVQLTLAGQPHVMLGDVTFPPGEPWTFGEQRELVQVYKTAFQVRQQVTLARSAPRGTPLSLAGHFTYQACTAKLCFPPATVPVEVTIPVARRGPR